MQEVLTPFSNEHVHSMRPIKTLNLIRYLTLSPSPVGPLWAGGSCGELGDSLVDFPVAPLGLAHIEGRRER